MSHTQDVERVCETLESASFAASQRRADRATIAQLQVALAESRDALTEANRVIAVYAEQWAMQAACIRALTSQLELRDALVRSLESELRLAQGGGGRSK